MSVKIKLISVPELAAAKIGFRCSVCKGFQEVDNPIMLNHTGKFPMCDECEKALTELILRERNKPTNNDKDKD